MLLKMWCCTLRSMDRTNHKFPVHATRNVQTQLKSTVSALYIVVVFFGTYNRSISVEESPPSSLHVYDSPEVDKAPQLAIQEVCSDNSLSVRYPYTVLYRESMLFSDRSV